MNLSRYVPRVFRAHAAVHLFYLAIAVLITWPLVTVFSTHFPGFSDSDAHEMTRHIWWFTYALQHGQPLIFQPLLGYPAGIQGVILWSDPLQFFPGWLFALFMPLPAAYNLFVLLTLALNGWAAYWLVSKLTENIPVGAQHAAPSRALPDYVSHLPALLAGLIFMAAPTLQGHLAGGHGGLLVQWPLPLLAYALLKLCGFLEDSPSSVRGAGSTRPSTQSSVLNFFHFKLFTLNFSLPIPHSSLITRCSLLSALLIFLTALGHTLQLIYAVMPLVAVIGLTLIIRHRWRALLRLIVVVAAGCALLFVLLLPVFRATFSTAAYEEAGGGVRYSADLLGIVTPSFDHILFGQWEYTHRVLGVNIVEGSSYIGVVAALLAIIAVWKVRAARWWLLLALVAWMLSLGPLLKVFDTPLQVTVDGHETYITLPWALLYNLPGFNLARTPGRFNFLLALSVAVLAGYGFAYLQSSVRNSFHFKLFTLNFSLSPQSSVLSTSAFLLLSAFVLIEYQSFWPFPTYSAEIPQAVYDLAKHDDVRAVFDVPWGNVIAAKDALWLQTAHHKPMIAGQVTRATPVSPAKLTILQDTLDPTLLNAAGVDVVILHKGYDTSFESTVRGKLGAPFYEDDRIALFDVPKPTAPEQFKASMTPFKQITDFTYSYFYAPESGWLHLQFSMSGEGQVSFNLDDQLMTQQTISGESNVALDFPLTAPGYHTVTMALNPPCPVIDDPIYACKNLSISDRSADFTPASLNSPIDFDRGVHLLGSTFDARDSHSPLTLWWQFDQPITDQDIRFVKVLDEQGKQVAGDDHPLGSFSAGQQLDSLSLDIPADLAPGTYKVYVGWYTYPDLTRFAVRSNVPGAQDGLAEIGEFTR